MSAKTGARAIVAQNRRARHDYFIDDTVEAGIVLAGTEVKSLRNGRASLNDSYATEDNGEIYLINAYIPEYQQAAHQFNHETRRPRKLLLHRREIRHLVGQITRKGVTLVPLSIYFKRGVAKVELGLARGKRKFDKRQTEKDRDWSRQKQRLLRDKG